jgi:hypothetical protein
VLAAVEQREAARRERAEREGRLGRLFREAAAAKPPQQQQEAAGQPDPQPGKPGAANTAAAPVQPPAFTFGFAL